MTSWAQTLRACSFRGLPCMTRREEFKPLSEGAGWDCPALYCSSFLNRDRNLRAYSQGSSESFREISVNLYGWVIITVMIHDDRFYITQMVSRPAIRRWYELTCLFCKNCLEKDRCSFFFTAAWRAVKTFPLVNHGFPSPLPCSQPEYIQKPLRFVMTHWYMQG